MRLWGGGEGTFRLACEQVSQFFFSTGYLPFCISVQVQFSRFVKPHLTIEDKYGKI